MKHIALARSAGSVNKVHHERQRDGGDYRPAEALHGASGRTSTVADPRTRRTTNRGPREGGDAGLEQARR
jgi:hypothetical protein